jgi:hypothetical protein
MLCIRTAIAIAITVFASGCASSTLGASGQPSSFGGSFVEAGARGGAAPVLVSARPIAHESSKRQISSGSSTKFVSLRAENRGCARPR